MGVEEKIKELEKEIRETPYNKATMRHVGELKARIARLKEKKEKSSGGSTQGYAPQKTGDATVLLTGFPSVGKSTILNELTNAEPEVAEYQFTTLEVIPGMLTYKGAKIQIFDVPGIIIGAAKGKGEGKEVLSLARSADLIVIVVDASEPDRLEKTVQELEKTGIRLDQDPPDVRIRKRGRGGLEVRSTVEQSNLDEETVKAFLKEYGVINAVVTINEDLNLERLEDAARKNRKYLPSVKVANKIDLVDEVSDDFDIGISAKEEKGLEELKENIFQPLGLIRIYMKRRGEDPDYDEPLIVNQGASIDEAAEKIHSSFDEARIWGESAKFGGQKVGLSHELCDEDVVELR